MLQQTQNEILEWSTRNFGRPVKIRYFLSILLTATHRLGEIAHHILKDSQGIRGDHAHHERMIVFLTEKLRIDVSRMEDEGLLQSATPEIFNFDCSSFLGVIEEVGELANAILHDDPSEIDDAIADTLVYILDMCGRNEKSAEDLLRKVWAKVKERDWKKNAVTGQVTSGT